MRCRWWRERLVHFELNPDVHEGNSIHQRLNGFILANQPPVRAGMWFSKKV